MNRLMRLALALSILTLLPIAMARSAQLRTAQALDASALEKLLAPYALYPDDLLAETLAATCYPGDLKEAAKWVKAGNDPSQIDAQGWNDHVKAVARTPSVLDQLTKDPVATEQLGRAVATQQKDVLNASQRLRARATKSGALKSSEAVTVDTSDQAIRIANAFPQGGVVAVPSFEAETVYSPVPGKSEQSLQYAMESGAYLNMAVDWQNDIVGWPDYGSLNVNVDVPDRGQQGFRSFAPDSQRTGALSASAQGARAGDRGFAATPAARGNVSAQATGPAARPAAGAKARTPPPAPRANPNVPRGAGGKPGPAAAAGGARNTGAFAGMGQQGNAQQMKQRAQASRAAAQAPRPQARPQPQRPQPRPQPQRPPPRPAYQAPRPPPPPAFQGARQRPAAVQNAANRGRASRGR